MTKEQLISTIKRLLNTDLEMAFLSKLEEVELETLIACIRGRVEGQ